MNIAKWSVILSASVFFLGVVPVLRAEDAAPALDTSWLNTASSSSESFTKSQQDFLSNINMQPTAVTLRAEIAKGVRAVISASINPALKASGLFNKADNQKFDWQKFIEDAYIEVRLDEVSGVPVAILVGKQDVAFGQQASRLPLSDEGLIYRVTREDQVIGITVKLDRHLLSQAIDMVEFSVFENGEGDLKIGDGAGFSVRMTKAFTEKLKGTASGLVKQNGDATPLNTMDRRASIGLVYNNGPGTWRAYLEGAVFAGDMEHLSSHYAATTGAAVDIGFGEVMVEYSYIQNTAQEVALAYGLPLGKYVVISPEVRHSFNADGSQDDRIGVRAKITFGQESEEKQN